MEGATGLPPLRGKINAGVGPVSTIRAVHDQHRALLFKGRG